MGDSLEALLDEKKLKKSLSSAVKATKKSALKAAKKAEKSMKGKKGKHAKKAAEAEKGATHNNRSARPSTKAAEEQAQLVQNALAMIDK